MLAVVRHGLAVFLVSRIIIILNRIWSIELGSILGEAGGAIVGISFGMVFDVTQPPLMNKSWKPLQLLRMANHLDRINLTLSSFQSHPEVTAAILLTLFDKVWDGDGIPSD